MCLVCFINAEESRSKQEYDTSNDDLIVCDNCITTSLTTQINSLINKEYTFLNQLSSSTASLSNTNNNVSLNNHAVHYFAIGSMTNMTALSLRELVPISSKPAILHGHRLLFRGSGGMASAEPVDDLSLYPNDVLDYPFDGIHGVLHLLTISHMKILDDFEGGYIRKTCQVHLYDGTIVHAFVYQMDRKKYNKSKEHALPTERYLDIIAKGCISHHVCPKWIEYIQKKHPCIPRKTPQEFTSFSMTSMIVPIISWDIVRSHNGIHPNKSMFIVINNKVLEFKGDTTSFFPYGYFVKNHIGGTDFTVKFAKGFYEPKYHISNYASSSGELEVEHREWIEDQFANPPPILADNSKWEFIGVVPSDFNIQNITRKSRTLSSEDTTVNSMTGVNVLDFSEYLYSGYNHFFITGNTVRNWIIPEGLWIGQVLHIRKTSLNNFDNNITIYIKNQDLSNTNKQSDKYIMLTNNYSICWCWDGFYWFLEYVS